MDYILALSALAGLVTGSIGTYLFGSSKLKFKDIEIQRLAAKNEEIENNFTVAQSKIETLREENLGIQTLLSGMEVEKDMLKEQVQASKEVQEKYKR